MVKWLIYWAFARGAWRALRNRRPVTITQAHRILKDVWDLHELEHQLMRENRLLEYTRQGVTPVWVDVPPLPANAFTVPLSRPPDR